MYQIDLKDLAKDMMELTEKFIQSKHEALSLTYSDENAPEQLPPALELAIFKTPKLAMRVPRLENRIQLITSATKYLAQTLKISKSRPKVSKLNDDLRSTEKIAGSFCCFLPNDAKNGVRLVYENYSFVIIVTPSGRYEYTL